MADADKDYLRCRKTSRMNRQSLDFLCVADYKIFEVNIRKKFQIIREKLNNFFVSFKKQCIFATLLTKVRTKK